MPNTMVSDTVTTVNTTVREHHTPELAVVEDLGVVRGADPPPLVPDQLEEAVLLERHLDEQVQRIGQDDADGRNRRGQQRIGSSRVPDSLPCKAAPPPRGEWELALGDGRHSCSFGREATHAPVFRILVI